jgi:hypothetical protein
VGFLAVAALVGVALLLPSPVTAMQNEQASFQDSDTLAWIIPDGNCELIIVSTGGYGIHQECLGLP